MVHAILVLELRLVAIREKPKLDAILILVARWNAGGPALVEAGLSVWIQPCWVEAK